MKKKNEMNAVPKQIGLTIHEESELYNPFDEELLNDDLISFLHDRFRRTGIDAALCIRSFCPLDESRFRNAFTRFCAEAKGDVERMRKRNHMRELRMLLIGIVFILLWLFISARTDGLGPEILSIIGSFAVWEAANVLIVENPELRLEKYLVNRLEKAEITIEYVKLAESPKDG